MTEPRSLPRVVSRAEWRASREELLEKEKELTRARDALNAERRRLPMVEIEPFRERMGWSIPWYSSHGTDFNPDFGVGPESPRPVAYQDGETFGLSVFLRDGDRVFRTYFTDRRGVEYLGSSFSYLDLTPFGRQEEWEDSPEGWPQGPTYEWWRHHDRYEIPSPRQEQPEHDESR